MGTSVERLFSNSLPVQLRHTDRDERKAHIQVTLEMHSVSAPLHRKELVVRLTDKSDLFFLYNLKLGEEDFQSLKSQQGLLVDFSAFPQKFIDLLELCQQEEHKEVPKFVLHLQSSDKSCASLNIVETNPFKHLTHLSLKLLPGNDTDVKKYLADCLKHSHEKNEEMQQKFASMESELQLKLRQTQEALSARTVELDNLKAEWTCRTNSLSSQHAKEVAKEREKVLQAQSNYQQRYERERRELEQAHLKIVKSMETRIYELETSNKDLTDRKYKSESTIRELKSKLSTFEDENQHIKQEVQGLRKENTSLDSTCHEQEKQINQLKTRIAVVEQELKDKDQVLAKSTDLLGSEQDQKKKYEEEIETKQRQISKMEVSIKSMSEELVKGNEIIKKLQGEIRTYHGKLKLRNKITTEQEKLLSEKEESLENIRKDLDKTKETLKQREDEVKKLNETLETTNEKLEESRQLIKTNENVISWLNRQVTEQQLTGHGRHGPFEMPSSTTSGAPVFRPSTSALHNFSTPALSSIGRSSAEPSSINTTGLPAQHGLHRQPQVQYRPSQGQPSVLPAPVSKSTPIPAIPEEISPNTIQKPRQPQNKENNPPFIDAKYLQPGHDSVPLRNTTSRSISPTPIQLGEGIFQPKTRLSQQAIVPKLNQKPTHPPLASAYFPNKMPKPN